MILITVCMSYSLTNAITLLDKYYRFLQLDKPFLYVSQ